MPAEQAGARRRAGLRQPVQGVEHVARLQRVGIRVPGKIARRIVTVGRRRRRPALRRLPVVRRRRQPVQRVIGVGHRSAVGVRRRNRHEVAVRVVSIVQRAFGRDLGQQPVAVVVGGVVGGAAGVGHRGPLRRAAGPVEVEQLSSVLTWRARSGAGEPSGVATEDQASSGRKVWRRARDQSPTHSQKKANEWGTRQLLAYSSRRIPYRESRVSTVAISSVTYRKLLYSLMSSRAVGRILGFHRCGSVQSTSPEASGRSTKMTDTLGDTRQLLHARPFSEAR